MAGMKKSAGEAILHVVLIYAVVAAAWILFSDMAVESMFADPRHVTQASIAKGWVFVAVTTLLLYVLLRRLVTRIRKMHDEHVRALDLLSSIAEGSDDAIFAKDRDGRYLLFNRAACEFVGRPPLAVLGRDDRALFPAEQAEQLMSIARRVMENGESETNEETLETPVGTRVFHATKGPLRDADGNIFGIFGISRDITARKHEEDEVRQLAADLEATLQAIPDLMFEMDADGRYLAVKAGQPGLLAAPAVDVLGRTVHEVLPADAALTVMDAIAAAARQGADFGHTLMLQLPAGRRWFELSVARKATPDGAPARFVVLSRDVTERKAALDVLQARTDELAHRNAELERFNRAVVDRELDMLDLKRQINELSQQLGRAEPYPRSSAAEVAPQGARLQ